MQTFPALGRSTVRVSLRPMPGRTQVLSAVGAAATCTRLSQECRNVGIRSGPESRRAIGSRGSQASAVADADEGAARSAGNILDTPASDLSEGPCARKPSETLNPVDCSEDWATSTIPLLDKLTSPQKLSTESGRQTSAALRPAAPRARKARQRHRPTTAPGNVPSTRAYCSGW